MQEKIFIPFGEEVLGLLTALAEPVRASVPLDARSGVDWYEDREPPAQNDFAGQCESKGLILVPYHHDYRCVRLLDGTLEFHFG